MKIKNLKCSRRITHAKTAHPPQSLRKRKLQKNIYQIQQLHLKALELSYNSPIIIFDDSSLRICLIEFHPLNKNSPITKIDI